MLSRLYLYRSGRAEKTEWATSTKQRRGKETQAVEADLDNGTFIRPNTTTVEDFLKSLWSFMEKRNGAFNLRQNTALINNYIKSFDWNLVVQDNHKRM